MPLLSVCCRDMPCVRIDLFIGKDSERVLNGFIPETGQCFTHDYLHRSAANSPCSIENAITYSVLLFYFKSVPEGSFFMNKKLAAIVLAAVLAGSVIASIIMHGKGFFLPWVDILLETLSDPENQWVILVCGLFGSLIALLRESKGTSGFTRIGERLCRTERGALLGTFILGVVIFVDDYLNMLTVGTCMRPICDRRKVPREALAYLLDSTGTPICVLLPFSTWTAFYISLFMKEEAVRAAGFSSGLAMYIQTIPFIFYASIMVVMVFLFAMGWMPMKLLALSLP